MKGSVIIIGVLIVFSSGTVVTDQTDPAPTDFVFENFVSEISNIRMGSDFNVSVCSIPESQRAEIRKYEDIVRDIFEATRGNGSFVGKTYKDLGTFVDKFGSRLSGSEALEKSIDYMLTQMEAAGLENLHTENATVPNWQRGEEKAELLKPRKKSLAVIAFGFSVPTPSEGLTSDVAVIDSLETLQKQKDQIKGKILVFTSNRSIFTLFGATIASQNGAVACLLRSNTPLSLNTPHTMVQFYDPSTPKIPVGALSAEDADLIGRLAESGEPIRIFLKLEVLSNGKTESRNVIGDFLGREAPGDKVLLSGHIDSWDVGQGAVDDGIGVLLTLEVINLLKHLKLQPRRTVRTVLWTAEEMGLYGARAWMSQHKTELSRYVAALESDYGCFKAMGYIFSGKSEVGCILNEIKNIMPQANLTMLTRSQFIPTDIAYMAAAGVPSIVLNGNDGRYFWYHHTEADVLTAMESKELDNCLAVWAATTFIVADMKQSLTPEAFIS